MEAQSGLLFAIDYVKFVSKNLNQKLLFSKLKFKKNWAVFELRLLSSLFSYSTLNPSNGVLMALLERNVGNKSGQTVLEGSAWKLLQECKIITLSIFTSIIIQIRRDNEQMNT